MADERPHPPACPGCGKADRVELITTKWDRELPDPASLESWWCARCNAVLSSLPSLPPPGSLFGEDTVRGKGWKHVE